MIYTLKCQYWVFDKQLVLWRGPLGVATDSTRRQFSQILSLTFLTLFRIYIVTIILKIESSPYIKPISQYFEIFQGVKKEKPHKQRILLFGLFKNALTSLLNCESWVSSMKNHHGQYCRAFWVNYSFGGQVECTCYPAPEQD